MKERTARTVAISILEEVEKGNQFSNQLLNHWDAEIEDSRERGLLRELVYGALTNRTYLDHIIDQASRVKTDRQDVDVKNILRIAVYQIVFLHTPDHAAIYEAVESAKDLGRKTAGFVNGVLRNIQRNLKKYLVVSAGSEKKDLSIRYSQPLWLLEYLEPYFAPGQLKKIVQKNNETVLPSVRVDTNRISMEDAAQQLTASGVNVIGRSGISETVLRTAGGPITSSELFRTGVISIQSQSSAKVVEVLDPQPGESILDLCAAPGSKSVYIAQRMRDEGHVVANDISEGKLKQIAENQARMDTHIVAPFASDASVLQEDWIEKFDRVLVDAPCSGFGILRRKPEIRWNRSMADVKELAALQKQILSNALQYVKPGGRLVYSTCTYGERENEAQLEQIDKSEAFANVPIDGKKALRLTPLDEDADGFFMARYDKKSTV